MFNAKKSFVGGLLVCALLIPVLAACGGTDATATTVPVVPPTTAPTVIPAAAAPTTAAVAPTAMAAMTPTTAAMAPTAMAAMTPTAMAAAPTTAPATGNKPTIIVASKDFAEERLVGEMYAQLLEQAGYKVDRKLGLGEVTVIQPALLNGDVQIYPEYTGTGLTVVLKKDPMSDPKQVFDTVSAAYESQFKLTWLDPAPMNDTQALATTKAIADKYGLKTLSDVAAKADQLNLTCAPAFVDRPDGIPGLQKAYGGFKFKDVKTVDLSLRYKALLAGQTDITEAFSTDGTIAGNNLVVMQDDKNFFPPYQIAPVIRDDVLAANPDIKAILNPLAPMLTNAAVSTFNWEVEGKKREVADVAKEFLLKQGLLKSGQAGAVAPTAMAAVTPTAMAAAPTTAPATGNKPTIIVASKDFAEERLVGEMYAQLLEQAGYKVDRKLGLGEVTVIQPALLNGDVQIYPEYTGTGLTVVLKKDPMSDPKQVFDTVSAAYESQFKLTWLDPAPMNDTQALATTKAIADKYGLKTLSDVAAKADQLNLTCAPAFVDRPDGIPGLQKAYGGFKFKDVKTVNLSLRYKALLAGQTDITEAFSTDGTIAGNNLVVMQDDKNFFPPYQIAPVVRDDVLAANPDIKAILNPLAPMLTNAAVSAFNWEVEGKKREVADVAKEFLLKQGLLK